MMGKVLFFRKGSKHTAPEALPAGYTRLRYIQSSGTQYINMNFTPNQDTKVEIVASWTPAASGSSFLFGASAGSKVRAFEFGGYGGRYRAMYNATETYFASTTFDQPMTVSVDQNAATINAAETVTADYAAFSAGYPLYLFATNRAGSAYGVSAAAIWTVKVYDNGTLVRNAVPCINAEGEAGLYDLIGRTFYGNAGEGSFTGSEEA